MPSRNCRVIGWPEPFTQRRKLSCARFVGIAAGALDRSGGGCRSGNRGTDGTASSRPSPCGNRPAPRACSFRWPAPGSSPVIPFDPMIRQVSTTPSVPSGTAPAGRAGGRHPTLTLMNSSLSRTISQSVSRTARSFCASRSAWGWGFVSADAGLSRRMTGAPIWPDGRAWRPSRRGNRWCRRRSGRCRWHPGTRPIPEAPAPRRASW
jgi:hypothetical protein